MDVYEHMKNSEVKWLCEIPSDWNIRVLFQLVEQVKNKNKDLQEKNLLSLSYGRIKRKDINNSEGLLPESFEGYNIIEKNDIVLRLTDLQNDHTSLRVGQSLERGIITSAYTTIRPNNKVNPRFLYFLLHAYDLVKGFYGMGSGVRQGLNYDEVKMIKVPLPDIDTQEKIAVFLDEICTKIDATIEDAKKSIDEYKAWKSSVIFEAITKGIEKNVELKDSGIEWIGKIPIDSRIIRLRYLIQNYKAGPFGSSLIMDKLTQNGNILIYTPEHVANQNVNSEKNLYLPDSREDEMAQFLVKEGDIIFPIVGSLGRAMAITRDMPKGIINQRLAKFSLDDKKIDPDYFMWMFGKSTFFNPYIEVNCRGSFIVNLTKTIVYDMPIVLPYDIKKQRNVREFLNEKCGLIDSITNDKEKLIADLELYKRSLIYEAVTGKRKVV